jgi:anti-sigma regulatory factor (Ser/Thr protein kinase)
MAATSSEGIHAMPASNEPMPEPASGLHPYPGLPGSRAGQNHELADAQEQPGSRTGDTVEFALPDDATAPGKARASVRDTLKRWRLPSLIDACELATSELVTNAFRHGRPPIGLSLRRRADAVRLDVSDSEPELVTNTGGDGGDGLAESGRGLDIVRAVADDVGTEGIPNDGKNVFASWHIRSQTPDSSA